MTTIRRAPATVAPAATPNRSTTASTTASTPSEVADATSAARVTDLNDFAPASPEAVMKKFYEAFTAQRPADFEGLYAPDVKFKDAVFEYSDRKGTMKMWRSILANPKNTFRFEFDRVEGDVAYGRWVGDYKLGGRPIRNELETRMVVRDGRIVEHTDDFDWGKWVKQALPGGGLFANRVGQKIITAVLRAVINR